MRVAYGKGDTFLLYSKLIFLFLKFQENCKFTTGRRGRPYILGPQAWHSTLLSEHFYLKYCYMRGILSLHMAGIVNCPQILIEVQILWNGDSHSLAPAWRCCADELRGICVNLTSDKPSSAVHLETQREGGKQSLALRHEVSVTLGTVRHSDNSSL